MEVEVKFSLDETAAQSLQALDELAGYRLGETRVIADVDQYLDTTDYRILRGGYACRIRERNGQLIATLKSLSPTDSEMHVREEFETALQPDAGDPPSWPPGAARDLALRLTNGAPLQPLCMIWQQRHVRPVLDGERLAGEWSLDQVETTAGDKTDRATELEIELKGDGTPDDLGRLAEALIAQPGVQPQPRSKFERAMGMLDLAKIQAALDAPADKRKAGPGVRAGDSMAEAGRKVLRFHFKRMQKEEKGARAGEDIEAVHAMRVATRRMRSALTLFEPYYRRRAIKVLNRGFKRTARALGAVRDLDVFVERAEVYRQRLPEARQMELDAMLRHWQRQRDGARDDLIEWLDSQDFEKFETEAAAFLDAGDGVAAKPKGDGIQPILVRHLAPTVIWEAYARVRAYDTVVADAPIETLHLLRIEGKRLRYTLEFFAEDLGPHAGWLVGQVVQMQDHLGALHDADVDAQALTEFLEERDGKPVELPGVRAYLSSRLADRARLRARFGRVWTIVNGPRFRRLLAQAVAHL
ncbi:MAG: CHAD domain-containing protein [Anaerolineae bacterium]|nr:CHAD domain-containing protein [Anaerolineae bacterium]